MLIITGVEIGIVIKLIIAAILGTLIGLEREVHQKPAGLRTHVLVCIGATLFAIVSFSTTGPTIDQSRIAAGVVLGIGFLGAGVIFQTTDKIRGLTTATELWVLAAVGLAVGIGMYFAAIATTIIILFILVPGKFLEKRAQKVLKKKR